MPDSRFYRLLGARPAPMRALPPHGPCAPPSRRVVRRAYYRLIRLRNEPRWRAWLIAARNAHRDVRRRL